MMPQWFIHLYEYPSRKTIFNEICFRLWLLATSVPGCIIFSKSNRFIENGKYVLYALKLGKKDHHLLKKYLGLFGQEIMHKYHPFHLQALII